MPTDDLPIDDDAARQASAAEFRAFLKEIGQTQCGFARTLKRTGDTRKKDAIQRHLSRIMLGNARISGEMRVIMTIFRRSHRKRTAQLAAAQTAAAQSGTAAQDHAGAG
jgi:type VI protein secretion system component VasK